ncbi:Eukaryotic translation initiation factor 4 gamma 1 [Halotydeus destructor]|nr:Eukaryotic translation initiation factor 4 gamma 1 [Halotydeus destructor]
MMSTSVRSGGQPASQQPQQQNQQQPTRNPPTGAAGQNFDGHSEQFGQHARAPLQYSQVAAQGSFHNNAAPVLVGPHEAKLPAGQRTIVGNQGQINAMYQNPQNAVNVGQGPVAHAGPPQQQSSGGQVNPINQHQPGLQNHGLPQRHFTPNMHQINQAHQSQAGHQNAGGGNRQGQFPGNQMQRPQYTRHPFVSQNAQPGQIVFPMAPFAAQAGGYQNHAVMNNHHHAASLQSPPSMVIPASSIATIHQGPQARFPHVQQHGQQHGPQQLYQYYLPYAGYPQMIFAQQPGPHNPQAHQSHQQQQVPAQQANSGSHPNQAPRGPPLGQVAQPVLPAPLPPGPHIGVGQALPNDAQASEGTRPPTGHSPAMSVTTMSPSAAVFKPREKKLALLQDPDSGKELDILALAKSDQKTPSDPASSSVQPSERVEDATTVSEPKEAATRKETVLVAVSANETKVNSKPVSDPTPKPNEPATLKQASNVALEFQNMVAEAAAGEKEAVDLSKDKATVKPVSLAKESESTKSIVDNVPVVVNERTAGVRDVGSDINKKAPVQVQNVSSSKEITAKEKHDTNQAPNSKPATDDPVNGESEATKETVLSDQDVVSPTQDNVVESQVPASNGQTAPDASALEDIDEPEEIPQEDPVDDPDQFRVDGKYVYERSDLQNFRNSPLSRQKPDLKVERSTDLDRLSHIILDHARLVDDSRVKSGQHGFGNASDPFLPQFAHQYNALGMSVSQRGPSRNSSTHGGGNRGGYAGRSSGQPDPRRKIIIPNPIVDVKLRTADNAWKPDVAVKVKPDAPEEVEDSDEARTQDLLKKFRGILNKITPQKFQVLLDRIDKLPIDTEERLKQILDLVFDKAVDEPAFCVQYAKLCKHLSNRSIVKLNDEQKEEQVKFQRLLLSRCQKEFETDIYVDIDVAGREAAIEACEEADKRKILVAEFEEEKRLARKKSLGNIKLIGELYKLEMLKGSIMVFCMHKLISELEEESLECLCTLLKTIGNQLEEECRKLGKSEEHLEPYFKRLEKIVRDKQTSSRIRFLIQDVLDMRRNGWKGRKIQDENKPKTIDQIHQDVKKEEQQNLMDHLKSGKKSRDESGAYYGRNSQSNRTQPSQMDFNALKQLRSDGAGTTFTGPNFSQWGKGSGSGQAQPQPVLSSRPSQDGRLGSNRYQTLSETNRDPRSSMASGRGSQQGQSRGDSRQGSRMDNRPGNMMSGPPKGAAFSSGGRSESTRGSSGRDSSVTSDGRQSASGSRNSSMQGSAARRDIPVSQSPAMSSRFSGSASTDESELNRKTANIVKEYNSNGYMNEVETSVLELCTESNVYKFANSAINSSLEASQEIRSSVARIFNDLYLKKVISCQSLCKGLAEVLEFADDLVIDIPKLWEFIGQDLSLVFIGLGNERKQFITSALQSYFGKPEAAKLLGSMLKTGVSLTSESLVQDAWSNSGLSWSDILGPNVNVEEYLKSNKLEFTTASPSSKDSTNATSSQLSDKIKEDLISKSRIGTNDEIAAVISENFNVPTIKPALASALFQSIIRGCIEPPTDESTGDAAYRLNEKTLTERAKYMAPFIQGLSEAEEVELSCLFALQELVEQLAHPSKLLDSIFRTLYHKDVISSEAFLAWEASSKVTKGKAMAVLSVKDFLKWVSEPKSDTEEET